MEEEREDSPLQVFYYRAEHETGELEMEDRNIAYLISRPLGFHDRVPLGVETKEWGKGGRLRRTPVMGAERKQRLSHSSGLQQAGVKSRKLSLQHGKGSEDDLPIPWPTWTAGFLRARASKGDHISL